VYVCLCVCACVQVSRITQNEAERTRAARAGHESRQAALSVPGPGGCSLLELVCCVSWAILCGGACDLCVQLECACQCCTMDICNIITFYTWRAPLPAYLRYTVLALLRRSCHRPTVGLARAVYVHLICPYIW